MAVRAVLGPPVDRGTVLVTGASVGIGRALAVELAARAATLVLVARRVERLEELRAQLAARHQGLTVIVAPGDLSDEADLERLVAAVAAQLGVVDVLVNNAGVGDAALFDQADWSRTSLRASTPAPSASKAGDRAESTTEYGPAPGQAAP